jgi:uncharacterized membrane protein YoaK (UPF0700 family)
MRDCGGAPVRTDPTDLALLEYQQLKEEQRLRITSRDNLVYATLVAVGAVCGAALQATSTTVLLLLPAICVVLGWTYVSNDRKVSEIGRHIRLDLVTRLPASAHAFPWESAHRAGSGYTLHKILQTGVTLLTFCGPGIAALVANRSAATASPPMLVLIIAEAACIALLAHQVLTNTDIRTPR